MADSPNGYSRKAELQETLQKLQELISTRTAQLAQLEWEIVQKTNLKNFTLLNLKAKGSLVQVNAMKIQKKDRDLECHISRRGLFFLRRREQEIRDELEKSKE